MRAVNLIPEDERRGGGAGAAGRSGGVVYLLLGGLAGMALLAGTWAMTAQGLPGKRSELTALQRETAVANARIQGVQGPTDLATRRRAQSDAVRGLLAGRQEWSATLDAIGRTLPADTTLTALDAAPAAAPSTAAAAAAAAGPSVQLSGCAPGQRAVARLMPRLRTIPGVQGVTLVSSALGGKTGAAAGAAASGSGASSCTGATFQMNMVLAGAPATGALPGATAAAAAPQNVAAPAPPPGATTAAPAAGTATTAVPGTPTAAPKP